jgi:proline iminopeptidase
VSRFKNKLYSFTFNLQSAVVRTARRVVNHKRCAVSRIVGKLKVIKKIAYSLPLVMAITSCVQTSKTIEFDESLPYTEIDGYKFHTEVFGSPDAPAVIVVHGGPGGDYGYLKSLKALSRDYRVIFYDQRGTGLSPRENKNRLTLEQNLDDLNSIIQHFSAESQVKLVGHSWGGMLVTGYLSA